MLAHNGSSSTWLEKRLHLLMLGLETVLLVLFFHNLHAIDTTSPDLALHFAIAGTLVLLMAVTSVKILSDFTVRHRLLSILKVNMEHEVLIALSNIKFHELPRHDSAAAGTAGDNTFQEHFQWTTAFDGLEAINRLVPLLKRVGFKETNIHIQFSEQIKDADLAKSNVFVIGGHQNNRIAKRLPHGELERLRVILRNNKITLPGGNPLDTEFPQAHSIRDFGLVTRMANPFFEAGDGAPCAFWLFEGVRQWGTRAGVTLLSDIATNTGRARINKHCPELKRNAVKAGPVQFVARCEATVDWDMDLLSNTEIIFPEAKGRTGSLFGLFSRIAHNLTAR